jgi:phosphoserine phosphatase RsbU/P
MSTTTTAPPGSGPGQRGRPLRSFWQRVTEGLAINQLWGQFISEAKASYGLYSKDVDWDEIRRERKRLKRFFRSAWAVFQAMLMKLSPARRVLLLIALVLLIVQPEFQWSSNQVGVGPFRLGEIGGLILFVLLALELADRVVMKRDLEIAREIQQWLVPSHPPFIPGFDIAFATRPQNTVAGDYYDAFLRPVAGAVQKSSLLVVVADVAGKSVPAALLMATFQAGLRALSATPESLDEIAVGLDRYARAHSLGGLRFTTAFLAEIDPDTREMRYINAGHNDPILRRVTGQVERLTTGGVPFGVPLAGDGNSSYTAGRVQLGIGDLLFIFTDGVIEAVDASGQEFTEARLLPIVQSAPPESAADTLRRVMTQVNTFVGQARQHDDITCLVLRTIPQPANAGTLQP